LLNLQENEVTKKNTQHSIYQQFIVYRQTINNKKYETQFMLPGIAMPFLKQSPKIPFGKPREHLKGTLVLNKSAAMIEAKPPIFVSFGFLQVK
jgi:hypothetical protein